MSTGGCDAICSQSGGYESDAGFDRDQDIAGGAGQGHAGAALRHRHARRRASWSGPRRRQPLSPLPDHHWQGRQAAAGLLRSVCPGLASAVPGPFPPPTGRAWGTCPVYQRPGGALDDAGLTAGCEAPRGALDAPARLPARVRHSSARKWRVPAPHSGAAGPHFAANDSDLPEPLDGANQAAVSPRAPPVPGPAAAILYVGGRP